MGPFHYHYYPHTACLAGLYPQAVRQLPAACPLPDFISPNIFMGHA